MTVIEAIRKRYSCRSYQDKPIEPQKLTEIFKTARLAPSAKNTQDWRFVVVTDKQAKAKVAQSTNKPEIFEKAAAIIVACSSSDEVMRCGQPLGPIDVAIVLDHISLLAADMGLATCWIGSFSPDEVRPILDIPENITIVELMAIGYPADKPKIPDRLPLEEILCYEKWKF